MINLSNQYTLHQDSVDSYILTNRFNQPIKQFQSFPSAIQWLMVCKPGANVALDLIQENEV